MNNNITHACIGNPCPICFPSTTTHPTWPLAQTHYHFTPQLSDADVERIAKRVAELIKESK